MPEIAGLPLIVTIFDAQLPVTPAGRPLMVAPVAPVVVYVMPVIVVLIHTVCASVPTAEFKTMVFIGLTIKEPIVDTVPQPPFSAIV